MSRLADAVQAQQKTHGPRCTIGQLLDTMPEDEAAELTEFLAGDAYGSTIAAALRAIGHDVADETLVRHRRGGCRCGK